MNWDFYLHEVGRMYESSWTQRKKTSWFSSSLTISTSPPLAWTSKHLQHIWSSLRKRNRTPVRWVSGTNSKPWAQRKQHPAPCGDMPPFSCGPVTIGRGLKAQEPSFSFQSVFVNLAFTGVPLTKSVRGGDRMQLRTTSQLLKRWDNCIINILAFYISQ